MYIFVHIMFFLQFLCLLQISRKTGDDVVLLDQAAFTHNIYEIAWLFRQSFNQEINPVLLRWRYLENPLPEILLAVESFKQHIIANYSASPVLMNIDGSKVKSALSMTTMTHPKYRGRGLFPQLAQELYEHMYHQGYNLIWGFPNNNSHRTFAGKLGWTDVYEVPTLILKVERELERKLELADDIEITMDNSFELNYENAQHLSKLIAIIKSNDYLKWRYGLNSGKKYSNFVIADENMVSSFCVVKSYFNSLDIVDLQARDFEAGFGLLRQVIKFAVLKQLEFINTWSPRHHFTHLIYEELGFINREPISYLGFRKLGRDDELRISDNFSDWYIQMGDSDVY